MAISTRGNQFQTENKFGAALFADTLERGHAVIGTAPSLISLLSAVFSPYMPSPSQISDAHVSDSGQMGSFELEESIASLQAATPGHVDFRIGHIIRAVKHPRRGLTVRLYGRLRR
ncbi:hypothetical protein KXV70_000307 [Aspergillus fumigatus]|nr:hypothetical protein KXX64_006055 [Aspergillus fumigatus]KAH1423013.1 hypothetical protein KXX22_002684 [Aspergillus fumigatus]KAH1505955.1 hypothetical protein KXX06_009242 [Aspergillus fumigatus]KAH1818150.1 hypothetical protein KXX19_000309 [Aspergillus fumigatus]KAH2180939.1 hypothetical protein KXV74_009304 [Aspergillus fumigatus]